MNYTLKLFITTPSAVLVDNRSVIAVRAMDESGSFGILPNHTDLVTALDDSVVRWRDDSNNTSYCAVRRGVLMVMNGDSVRIACREGLTGTELTKLKQRVRELRTEQTDADREETLRQMRMHTQAMRHIMGYLGNTPSQVAGSTSSVMIQDRSRLSP